MKDLGPPTADELEWYAAIHHINLSEAEREELWISIGKVLEHDCPAIISPEG